MNVYWSLQMNEGKKNDRKDDKTRWELMPLDCLEDIARVYTEGAKKYRDNNWQNLENGYERYKGALLRHLLASETKDIDEETGCYHLAQCAWNAISLLWYIKHNPAQVNKEIWRTAYNFPDYEVSNYGRVRSKDRDVHYIDGTIRKLVGKILKLKKDKKGYITVSLQRDKKNFKVKVHRLVLSTFTNTIGEQVNHIDENKENNKLSNLEWCSCKYNNSYGTRGYRCSLLKQKPLLQYKGNELVREYSSISEASRVTGISNGNISRACNNIYSQAGGFTWKFKE